MINSGSLDQQGMAVRSQALAAASDAGEIVTNRTMQPAALAGNTPLGGDYHTAPKSKEISETTTDSIENNPQANADLLSNIEVAKPLAKTRIISTVSAKLSYLIDAIIKYQGHEQILIFYDNDNVAFYLASVLEIVGHSPTHRVLEPDNLRSSSKFSI